MRERYLCPKHYEDTPSAVVYGNRFFCFGCGASGDVSEMGEEVVKKEKDAPVYVENLNASLERIRNLPRCPVRGFELPCDDRGYYLVWPDNSYYKLRRTDVGDGGNKYKGPTGHRKPPFVMRFNPDDGILALIEGEMNAMTLALLKLPIGIVSPGGAGDFYSETAKRYLTEYSKFANIFIIVDKDPAGAKAAIETKVGLMSLGCQNVHVCLMDKDFNDVFLEQGEEGLREQAQRMGLCGRVQCDQKYLPTS